jgi:hypothetical protein
VVHDGNQFAADKVSGVILPRMSKRTNELMVEETTDWLRLMPASVLTLISTHFDTAGGEAARSDCVALANLARCDRALYAQFSPRLPAMVVLNWCLLCRQRTGIGEAVCHAWEGCLLHAALAKEGRQWRADGTDGLCRQCCQDKRCAVCGGCRCRACDTPGRFFLCAGCDEPICEDCREFLHTYDKSRCLACFTEFNAWPRNEAPEDQL